MKKRVLVGMTALLLSLSLLMAQEIPAGLRHLKEEARKS